ncbi:MAG: hypothetical protein MI862_28875, partial [Desulfobacterales bacterium]|nr:hypothetical protein [Desulfobacterales bacterium]
MAKPVLKLSEQSKKASNSHCSVQRTQCNCQHSPNAYEPLLEQLCTWKSLLKQKELLTPPDRDMKQPLRQTTLLKRGRIVSRLGAP